MKPEIAVIARVGAHRAFEAAGLKPEKTEVLATPYGDSRPVHFFRHEGLEFAVLSRHGEAGYDLSAPFLNPRANLYALKNLGVAKILAWVAPGSLREELAPGDLVAPHDVLDEGKGGPHTFFAGVGWGFIRHNPLFCPELRDAMLTALAGVPFTVHDHGVYVATTGPRLETAAEIRKFRLLGGDLVGQTLAPEVFLARELEFCYAALTYVVNYAEGLAGPALPARGAVRGPGHPGGDRPGGRGGGGLPGVDPEDFTGPGRHPPALPLPPAAGALPPPGRSRPGLAHLGAMNICRGGTASPSNVGFAPEIGTGTEACPPRHG